MALTFRGEPVHIVDIDGNRTKVFFFERSTQDCFWVDTFEVETGVPLAADAVGISESEEVPLH